MNRELAVGKGDLVADLHFVEKPFRVALQNLRKLHPHFARRFPEPVHNPAQGRFVNSQHSRQPVLPDASRVHPKLQIGIDISIDSH